MTVEPRLYLDMTFQPGAELALDKDASHYLVTVMRRKAGDGVRVFNGRDGEWRAEVAEANKRGAVLRLSDQTRPQRAAPDMALYCAPVKKARTDFIVEKATELGVASITPVMTARTMAERVRTDRLQSLVREAAEQTERLDLPAVHELVALTQLLKSWDPDRRLIFADEAGDDDAVPWGGQSGRARPIAEALAAFAAHPTPALPSRGGKGDPAALDTCGYDTERFIVSNDGEYLEDRATASPSPSGGGRGGGRTQQKWALLIGPEGGFAPEERQLLRAQAFVVPVSLGPRILRADTAVAAALSVWQSMLGDWG